MEVYAVWNRARKAWVGSNYYLSDMPKIYLMRGAANNKAKRYFRRWGEECEVRVFELVEKED